MTVGNRYDKMIYTRCGRSGIMLPAISLGLWHNFGAIDDMRNCRAMIKTAFDLGITHSTLRIITARLPVLQRKLSAKFSNPIWHLIAMS
jgi:hypothetical protein